MYTQMQNNRSPSYETFYQLANILFLDQPVGVGFSYKRTPNIDKTSDTIEVVRIYEFLQKVKYNHNSLEHVFVHRHLISIFVVVGVHHCCCEVAGPTS